MRLVQVIHGCVLHNLANAGDIRLFDPPEEDENADQQALEADLCEDDFEIPDNPLGKELRDNLCRRFAAEK